MITDTNTVTGFVTNVISSTLGGGDVFIFIGIILFLCFSIAMIYARVRASTAVMIGAILSVMLSFVAPEFSFLFWIAVVASLAVLINGLRKMWSGY